MMTQLLSFQSFFVVLLVTLVAGCADNAKPYTEQTAQIDPAMNQPEMPSQDASADASDADTAAESQNDKVVLTDEQWREVLSEEEFSVLRRSGTEYAGTGRYLDHGSDEEGDYHCVGCGNNLYAAKHKFHSGCGWPAFNQEARKGAITEHRDASHGMVRTEMRCARCDGHLGHIFNDGFDQPTGLRHCVNGTALIFVPKGKDVVDVIKAHRAKYASQ